MTNRETGNRGNDRGASPRARKGYQSARSGPAWRRLPFGVYFAVFAVIVLGLAIGLPRYLSSRGDSAAQGDLKAATLPRTDIGKVAPAFSLKDQNGQTYSAAPGDGKPYVLVFYMGYF